MEEDRMNDVIPAARVHEIARRLRDGLNARVLGQEEVVEGLLTAYLAGGHVLLEGLPGVGKTLLARSFAEALGQGFGRVQFTPDVMPADLIGTNVFDAPSGSFRLVKGPVFSPVLMADEVNRTPPKTQSALLEAMQEGQVTIDGHTHPLPDGFFVIATQNPIEFEGTYPLPEAQLDRFLLRLRVGHPPRSAEQAMYRAALAGTLAGWSDRRPQAPLAVPGEPAALRHAASKVHVGEDLLEYLVALTAAVRENAHVDVAVSPRAGLSLLEVARAGALLEERDFVLPDDVKRWLVPCWAHRILLRPESELEGARPATILEDIAKSVPVPKAGPRA
jgi:MoxR-like ATPase